MLKRVQSLIAGSLERRLKLDVILFQKRFCDIGAVFAVPAEIVERTAKLFCPRARRQTEDIQGDKPRCAADNLTAAQIGVEFGVAEAAKELLLMSISKGAFRRQ